jgi:hypothetical protein
MREQTDTMVVSHTKSFPVGAPISAALSATNPTPPMNRHRQTYRRLERQCAAALSGLLADSIGFLDTPTGLRAGHLILIEPLVNPIFPRSACLQVEKR